MYAMNKYNNNTDAPLLQMQDVQFAWKNTDPNTTSAQLHIAAFSMKAGERVFIHGPSGCGKSTLLNILGLLDLPDCGAYHFAGHDIFHATPDQLAAIRNQQIVDSADRVVAFWDGKSRGTADTLRRAHAAGKPILIIGPTGEPAGYEPAPLPVVSSPKEGA